MLFQIRGKAQPTAADITRLLDTTRTKAADEQVSAHPMTKDVGIRPFLISAIFPIILQCLALGQHSSSLSPTTGNSKIDIFHSLYAYIVWLDILLHIVEHLALCQ